MPWICKTKVVLSHCTMFVKFYAGKKLIFFLNFKRFCLFLLFWNLSKLFLVHLSIFCIPFSMLPYHATSGTPSLGPPLPPLPSHSMFLGDVFGISDLMAASPNSLCKPFFFHALHNYEFAIITTSSTTGL